MEKKDVIAFFDHLAHHWDADMVKDDAIIGRILDGAGVAPGKTVLDVACGTGVMIPYYLDRQAAHITAMDISSEMAWIASKKFPQDNVRILCGDVEALPPAGPFDCIVIYNALPHFPDPENLLRVLSQKLVPGGTLTVAHGMSRAKIDSHHAGAARKVSLGLLHQDDLAALMGKYLTVTVKISNDQMYQVTGAK